jgi:DNA segregation ATPase FtsK/SpoIIIE and related proteins
MGFLEWLENHEAAVSSIICCGCGFISLAWSTVNPGINPSRFYSAGVTGLFGVGAIALSIKGLKEEERNIIKRDTQDEIFGLYQVAEVQTVKNVLFPPRPMPNPPDIYSQYYQMQFGGSQLGEGLDIKKLEAVDFTSIPHILLLAPTGWGKTTNGGYILSKLPGDMIVIDPHAEPNQWANIPVLQPKTFRDGNKVKRDYSNIARFLESIEGLMADRYERRSQGDNNFTPLNLVIDEFPACITGLSQCGFNFGDWFASLLFEARKVKIRLVLLTQGKSVKSLNIEGRSEVLECLTFIRGNGFAVDHCKTLSKNTKDDPLLNWVRTQPRPSMINDSGLELPDLSNFTIQNRPPLSNESVRLLQLAMAEQTPNTEPVEARQEPQLPRFNLQKQPEPKPKPNPVVNGVELQSEWLEVLELSKQNGTISARDVYRSALGQRLKLNATTARYILDKLAEAKLGTVTEINGSFTFTPTSDMA